MISWPLNEDVPVIMSTLNAGARGPSTPVPAVLFPFICISTPCSAVADCTPGTLVTAVPAPTGTPRASGPVSM